MVLIYFPCYVSNDLLVELTKEDGFYEYGGAILFLLTSIAFFVLVAKPSLYQNKASKPYPQRKFFLFFAILFFFAFGEEISWGQRILNFATPESLKKLNMQEEFNLHNIDVFHGITADGKEKTGFSALLTMHKMFYLACLLYLLVLPILYKKDKIESFIDKLGAPVPSIFFGLVFIVNWIYSRMLAANNTLDNHGIVEIKEAVIALILFTIPLSIFYFKSMGSKTT